MFNYNLYTASLLYMNQNSSVSSFANDNYMGCCAGQNRSIWLSFGGTPGWGQRAGQYWNHVSVSTSGEPLNNDPSLTNTDPNQHRGKPGLSY